MSEVPGVFKKHWDAERLTRLEHTRGDVHKAVASSDGEAVFVREVRKPLNERSGAEAALRGARRPMTGSAPGRTRRAAPDGGNGAG